MKYLLDKNVCIKFLGGKNAVFLERFISIPQTDKWEIIRDEYEKI